jgi:hypothetical protein
LQHLVIRDNDQLQKLPEFGSLAALRYLEIAGNEELKHLPALDGLARLEQLEISYNPELREIPTLTEAFNLKIVRIFDNEQLVGLPELPIGQQMELIYFEGSTIEASIDDLLEVPETWTVEASSKYIEHGFEERLNRERAEHGLLPIRVKPID